MRKGFLVLLLVVAACSKKNAGSGDGGTGSSGSAGAAGPLNATLVGHMKSLAEGCTSVNVEYGQATGCKDGLESAIRKYVTDTKPADFISTLATLALKKEDPKIAAVAVETIYAQFDYLGEAGKKANATPAAVDLILAAYKDSTGPRGVRLGKPAAQLATLAKENDKLFATIAANTGPTSQNEAYLNVLVYGRLDAFPKLKEVAAAKPGNAAAALDAIRRVPKATDAEKSAMCPWAKGFLGNADLKVAASAGNDMVWCRGEYIDALVTEAEKRVKDKQYKDPFAPVMREPCFEFAGKLTPAAADVAQCERVYTFLEKASNDPGVDDATRGLALWNIYYQRRDAASLKVMRKYEKSPNKEVAKRAGEAIKSLTETYKLKG